MKLALATSWFVLASLGFAQTRVQAAEYVVSTTGSDGNAGTLAQPFATLERAQMAAVPGDTVLIRGGEYSFGGTQAEVGVAFTKSGTAGQPIHYLAYPGETPIFDLFNLKPNARVTGLDVHGNWIHIRGLEVRGVRQLVVGDSWGVRIRGDHNVLEQLNVHDCEAPGVFITSGASNLILNSDSHENYDPLENGGNADGFGCHSAGGDNVLRGCRAWDNSDDGFDFINAAGKCTVEGSWSFHNGFIPNTTMASGNGGGFKAGGFGEPPSVPETGVPRHMIRLNLAFDNRAIGFYANHHPGGIDFFNNTAFDNPANFDMRPATGMTSDHELRNNLTVEPGHAIVNFSGGTDTFNAWTLPVTVTAADFASMDKSLARSPRQTDGSLPHVPFMRLSVGSALIDKGVDVGLAFSGSAPDLGAFESEQTAPPLASRADAGVMEASSGAGASAEPSADAGSSTLQPVAAGVFAGAATAAPSAVAAVGGTAAPVRNSDCSCQVNRAGRHPCPWPGLLAALCLAVRAGARRAAPRRRAAP